MDHLDKLIPLVVLIGVAAFLIFVLRRVARENQDATPPIAPIPKLSQPAEPVELGVPAIAAVVTEPPPVVEPDAPVKRPSRVKRKVIPAIVAPTTTMETVLGLLKDKDALTVALVLREILGPPVSKRTRDICL